MAGPTAKQPLVALKVDDLFTPVFLMHDLFDTLIEGTKLEKDEAWSLAAVSRAFKGSIRPCWKGVISFITENAAQAFRHSQLYRPTAILYSMDWTHPSWAKLDTRSVNAAFSCVDTLVAAPLPRDSVGLFTETSNLLYKAFECGALRNLRVAFFSIVGDITSGGLLEFFFRNVRSEMCMQHPQKIVIVLTRTTKQSMEDLCSSPSMRSLGHLTLTQTGLDNDQIKLLTAAMSPEKDTPALFQNLKELDIASRYRNPRDYKLGLSEMNALVRAAAKLESLESLTLPLLYLPGNEEIKDVVSKTFKVFWYDGDMPKIVFSKRRGGA